MPESSSPGGVDLHTHTNCSDGVFSPSEVVRAALDAGLEAVAITDHDTLAGIDEARHAALDAPIELVVGVELSARIHNRELHILGLFVDQTNLDLVTLGKAQRDNRRDRAERIVARAQALRIELSMAAIDRCAAGAPIGRPHVARALVAAAVVPNQEQAFKQYLGIGRPLGVPKQLPDYRHAIETIHRAGGVAVVAHAGSSRIRNKLLLDLAAAGIDGIEIRHPQHGRNREIRLSDAARRLELLRSGGSDFHGPGRGNSTIGSCRVPMLWCEKLRQRSNRHRAENDCTERPL